VARQEAQGRLQQERTTLEGAQATLKQRDDDVSWLNRELVWLSISHEDLRPSLQEQEATVHDLRREAEEGRKSLDSERKQVEGELRFRPSSFVDLACSGSAPDFCFFVIGFSGLRTALGNTTTQAEAVQTAYNSSQQELEELWSATLEVC
jgi:hypothetical protein